MFGKSRGALIRKNTIALLVVAGILSGVCVELCRVRQADAVVSGLPSPTALLTLSAQSESPTLRGIRFDLLNPRTLDFIIDPGSERVKDRDREQVCAQLVRYFMAGLVIPEARLWVNLAPYEQDRIIQQECAVTELGRDLLAEDYILKQLTSSLTHPDTETGKAYWSSLSTVDRPLSTAEGNAFSKIWIVPGELRIYEQNGLAVIDTARLKVESEDPAYAASGLLAQIETQVNEGRHFARLRQIYRALVLASWFKQRALGGLFAEYADTSRVSGIDSVDAKTKNTIHKLYTQSFEKGVYDELRTSVDGNQSQLQGEKEKRRYVSGGFAASALKEMIPASSSALTNEAWKKMKALFYRCWHTAVTFGSNRAVPEAKGEAKPVVTEITPEQKQAAVEKAKQLLTTASKDNQLDGEQLKDVLLGVQAGLTDEIEPDLDARWIFAESLKIALESGVVKPGVIADWPQFEDVFEFFLPGKSGESNSYANWLLARSLVALLTSGIVKRGVMVEKTQLDDFLNMCIPDSSVELYKDVRLTLAKAMGYVCPAGLFFELLARCDAEQDGEKKALLLTAVFCSWLGNPAEWTDIASRLNNAWSAVLCEMPREFSGVELDNKRIDYTIKMFNSADGGAEIAMQLKRAWYEQTVLSKSDTFSIENFGRPIADSDRAQILYSLPWGDFTELMKKHNGLESEANVVAALAEAKRRRRYILLTFRSRRVSEVCSRPGC
jgi:hypothetical protein